MVKRQVPKTLLILTAVVALSPALALAHGSLESPISRNYQCYKEGPENPKSAACLAARNAFGTAQFYDWMSYSQNPNGNHQAFVPNGMLCSAGRANYGGVNLTRTDWPATNVTAGATTTFVYHATAPHASQYHWFYITRNGYSLTQPLRWADLEGPFCTYGNVPLTDQRYRMSCRLPTGKTGRHILYHVWQRSDSPEAFYACSDLNFGGGTNPPPTPPPPPPPTTMPPTPPPPTTLPPPSPGGTWQPWVAYGVGAQVTYGGVAYQCRQAHTSQPGWEPPAVPALWLRR